MSPATKPITAEEFMQMHFDVPVELVRGEIVSLYGKNGMTRPGWTHGIVQANVTSELRTWNRRTRAGKVVGDAGVVTERDPDTVRGPDAVPNLCVEICSPRKTWKEIHRKIDEYFERGNDEVWVVHPQKRTVEVFRSDEPPVTLDATQTIESRELPGFSCPVEVFFEDID